MERVVISGLGVISALGPNRSECWASLSTGKGAIAPLSIVDGSQFRFSRGAEVRGYDPFAHFNPKHASSMDRFAQFAVIAAREAVADAGIEWTPRLRERTAV